MAFAKGSSLVLDALVDACLDSLKLLPFLFLTYLFMEWLEHGSKGSFQNLVAKAGPLGPVVGSILGVVPQCGFSGAAATLYAARVVSLGTLVAIFLVTSDEMLPVMISQAVPVSVIAKILAIKLVTGLVTGLVLDAILRARGREHEGFASRHVHDGHDGHDISHLCEQEGCDCAKGCSCESCTSSGRCPVALDQSQSLSQALEHDHGHGHEHGHEHEHGHHHQGLEGCSSHAHQGHSRQIRWGHLFLAALRHSLQITVFVLAITFLLNLATSVGMESLLGSTLSDSPASVVVAAVLGFIPNCAVSVGLTQLYLEGVLGGAACVAGLLTNAGVGLLVLLRTNNDFRENLRIMELLFLVALVVALVVGALGIL